MCENMLSPGNYHAVNIWRRETFAPGIPKNVTLTERKLWTVNPSDHEFRAKYIHEIPDWLAGYFSQRYEKLYNAPRGGRRRANTFLRQTIGQNVLPRLRNVMSRYKLPGDVDDLSFGKALQRLPSLDRLEIKKLSTRVSMWLAESFYTFTDTAFEDATQDPAEMHRRTLLSYQHLGELCLMLGNTPPYWAEYQANKNQLDTQKAESGLLRLMAPVWWYARLKRMRDIQREHLAIAVGQVQKAATAYVSRGTLGEWLEQKKRNTEFFKKFDLVNNEDDRLAMTDLVYGSVSNPAIRRAELMTRMRGFEDLADEQELAGEFYTITAPSRFHAVHSGGGFVSQWNGSNPQDTQKYLCNVWAKSRAALSRAGIHIFGFRVVEPHHDGTPHWHMLLFMRPQDVDAVRDILCYQARITDSEELQTPNALTARFHVEPIDPAKGSATGYIAKYISKNIDGYALDGEKDDETGESLRDMAKAVSAWASRWRIRQFQQIGGAPVTVWRELRRLRDQRLVPVPMATAEGGMYQYPPEGALVEVGFADGRQDKPIIRQTLQTDLALPDIKPGEQLQQQRHGVSQRVTQDGSWQRETDQVISEKSRLRVVTADAEQRTVTRRETTVNANDTTTVLGTKKLLAGAVLNVIDGDYTTGANGSMFSHVAKNREEYTGQNINAEVAGTLTEKIRGIRRSVAAVQELIAPSVRLGGDELNVLTLLTDTLDVIGELADLTAAHRHPDTGTPTNAGAIESVSKRTQTLNNKYSPFIAS